MGPPTALEEGVQLPPGTPKVLDAEVAVAVAAWLASASTTIDDGVVVGSYSEAGFRCILAREKQALGRYLKEGDSLVGVNGLHVEDDTAVHTLLPTHPPLGNAQFTL